MSVANLNKLWKHYYDRVDGIIFVVDSTDTERINEANSELESILLESTLKDVPILIFWNKTDISADTTVEKQILERLKWLKTTNDNFEISPWSAKTGVGVSEGIAKLQKLFIS